MITLTARENLINITAGKTAEIHLEVRNEDPVPRQVSVRHDISVVGSRVDAVDWKAFITGLEHDESSGGYSISLEGGASKKFVMNVDVPKGAEYGDHVDIRVSASTGSESHSLDVSVRAVQGIFVVKTAIGHERTVMDTLESRIRTQDLDVKSMLASDALRGYVMLEAMNIDKLKEVVKGVRRARTIIEGDISMDDIEKYLTPKKATEGISVSDIVEIVSGGFKGERARVMKIDEIREEVTVELFEAIVPIPITVSGSNIKLIEKKRESG